MNTTSLFVELVVIGMGVIMWILMLIMAFFGYQPVIYIMTQKDMLSDPFLVVISLFIFPLGYILGIVFDRIANWLFDFLGNRLKKKIFEKEGKSLFERRYLIYEQSEYLSSLLEYGRSRLRVCRGWALNFLLISLSTVLFLCQQLKGAEKFHNLLAFTIVTGTLLTVITTWSWYRLAKTEYQKVKEQSDFWNRNKINLTHRQKTFLYNRVGFTRSG